MIFNMQNRMCFVYIVTIYRHYVSVFPRLELTPKKIFGRKTQQQNHQYTMADCFHFNNIETLRDIQTH